MRRGSICKWQQKPPFIFRSCERKSYLVLAPVSRSYPKLTGRLPTWYSPIRRSFHRRPPEGFSLLPALDLHVLGTPPAFVLSQDQTLHKMVCFMFSSPMKTLSFKIKVLTRFKHVECINIRLSLLDIYCCLCSVFKEQIKHSFYRLHWSDFTNITFIYY